MIYNLDLKFCSFQLGQEISKEEIEMEIERLKKEKIKRANTNNNYKRILNSIYGVIGFAKFILYDKRIAESVTMQSVNVIKYTIKIADNYFDKRFPTLTELHTKLGITTACPVDWCTNYADTDSIFINYHKIISATDYKGKFEDFVFTINKEDFDAYVRFQLVKYVNMCNGFQKKLSGKPAFILTFEQLCHNILWTSKKKYVKNVLWSDGSFFKPLERIDVKGLDINKASSPKFVRDKLMETVKFILSMGGEIDSYELTQFVKKIKNEFELNMVENVSMTQRVNGYEKYVIKASNDNLEFVKSIPIGVRACAIYNNALSKSNVKMKYQVIKSGTKVKWYYTTNPAHNVFAFIDYPYEFAPPLDVDKQFESTYLNPLNIILEAIGMSPMSSSLVTFQPLF